MFIPMWLLAIVAILVFSMLAASNSSQSAETPAQQRKRLGDYEFSRNANSPISIKNEDITFKESHLGRFISKLFVRRAI